MWAEAVAAGVPDELFWTSTPYETRTLTEKLADRDEARERAATLRAGLVASAVYNVHRKKGARALKPTDFIRTEQRRLSVEEARARLDAWARSQNETHEA